MIPLYRGRGENDYRGLANESLKNVEGMKHGNGDIEVLAGHAKGGSLDEEFPVGTNGGGFGHVITLSKGETVADGALKRGRWFFGRAFGVKGLSAVSVRVDSEVGEIARDGHTQKAWGKSKSHKRRAPGNGRSRSMGHQQG